MDLSNTLQEIEFKDREDEARTRKLLELSAKKYNLQKELDNLKTRLTVKKSEVDRLHKEVKTLLFEVPVLERQEKEIKNAVEELLKDVFNKDAQATKIQNNFWTKINEFVSSTKWFLTKRQQQSSTRNKPDDNRALLSLTNRENEIRQLKVASQLEAMHLYEQYQTRKLEELKLIRELLEKESFVI